MSFVLAPTLTHHQIVETLPAEPKKVIHVGQLRSAAKRGGWLLIETALMPMFLLWVGLTVSGPLLGLGAVLTWRLGFVFGRIIKGVRVPATVVLSTSVFVVRTIVSMSLLSVLVYLWQPVIMATIFGVIFTASAFMKTPVTMKLMADVITLPEITKTDPRIRTIFGQMSLIWGVLHLLNAGFSAWTLKGDLTNVVLLHGVLGMSCALLSAVGGALWGWFMVKRLPDIEVRFDNADPTT